jgi:Mechanosensitive ion channel, beta-domain
VAAVDHRGCIGALVLGDRIPGGRSDRVLRCLVRAQQHVLSLLLLTTRSFRVGDYIEVLESGEKPGLRGTVTAIHLIYTTLTENEPGAASSVLQVPNSLFFQRVVRRTGAPPIGT